MKGFGTYVFTVFAIGWLILSGFDEVGISLDVRMTVAGGLFGAAGLRLRAAVGRPPETPEYTGGRRPL